jgi:pimeloyl-ACP methyl ester carboxylesterase
VIPSLASLGPVVAPDLPGSIFGETTTHRAYEAKLEPSVPFLDRLTSALGPDRIAQHGMSMGGMAGLLFAAEHPGRVHLLVMANSFLPTRMRRLGRLGWNTLGRLALTAGPAVVRALMRLRGRRLVDAKVRQLTDPEQLVASGRVSGGDVTRIAPESLALAADQMREVREHPARLGHTVTAFASATFAAFVAPRRMLEATDAIAVPVLLVWGDQDLLVHREAIDHALE